MLIKKAETTSNSAYERPIMDHPDIEDEDRLSNDSESSVVKIIAANRYDEDDDEISSQNFPSIAKITTVSLAAFAATSLAMYYKANPIVYVGLSQILGTTLKSALRRVPIKTRYISVITTAGLGYLADCFNPIKLNFGPILSMASISCFARTAKLWIIGRSDKDK